MTINSVHNARSRRSQPPISINERVKMLPVQVQNEILNTQQSQLYEFYEAMLQPSTLPFAAQDEITSITPKIGDKISMLANVRETLTKRY